ncbi:MAG: hypothetical protein EKK64_04480 [Neisseriaceae bacterium]|jgi:hypothetical protein|nr:MAG: hypothetical protein EKK64_04480 [Neisseriaceae bacterium]
MRKIVILLISIGFLSSASAQSVNWYMWIINNSSNKNIVIDDADSKWWDNYGWAPCDTNWHGGVTGPNSTTLKCGGTTSKSVNAWLAYVITVKDKNTGNVIYERRHSWDVHNDTPANLSIKNGAWNDGGTNRYFNLTDNLNDKDGVVIYVFDDNGFSTTVLTYGNYSYDPNNKSFDFNKNRCQDSHNGVGCTMYNYYK